MKIRPEVVLMYLLTVVGFVGGLTLYPIIDAGYKRMIKSVPAPATTSDNSITALAHRIAVLERTEWRLVTVTNSEGWAWSEVHKFSKP